MRLDVQADLTPLFSNWNTKQLYVSVVADWNSTTEKVSSFDTSLVANTDFATAPYVSRLMPQQ